MRSRLRDIQAGGLLKTGEDTMKKKIHPDNYREVVFQDFNADFSFLTRSAVKTTETIQWEDGKEYPLFKLDISSASHPFYTGKQTFVDTAGRVEKFKQRFAWEKGKAAEVIDQAEEQRTEKHRKQLEQEEATRKEAAERKSAREDRRRKILVGKKKKAEEQAEAKAAEEAAAAAAAAAAAPAAEAPAAEAPAAEAPAAEAPAAKTPATEAPAAADAAAEKPADTDS
jgi:large subunit ribosomal protein L31